MPEAQHLLEPSVGVAVTQLSSMRPLPQWPLERLKEAGDPGH